MPPSPKLSMGSCDETMQKESDPQRRILTPNGAFWFA